MIVRDEERVLSRCLRSFAGAFDELNVVDTGSRDGTIAIASQFGARLRSFTGCNGPDGRIENFSLARNLSCEMATQDWILWMDADDVLQQGGAERFRKAAAGGAFAGLHTTIRWEQDTWFQVRLFRNDPRNRFAGRVHEYPVIHGEIGADPLIVVDHHPDKTGKEGSNERNLRLCEVEVREDPTNLRALFHLGTCYRLAGRHEQAIFRYQQYLALPSSFPQERYTTAYFLALSLFALRRWEDCIDAALRAVRLDPRYAEPYCLIGDVHGELRDYAFARQWYRTALSCGAPPPDALLFVDRRKYDEYPRLAIAVCDEKLGARRGDPA
jgi:glycosyltransferase involved in cell wall biosynthesis